MNEVDSTTSVIINGRKRAGIAIRLWNQMFFLTFSCSLHCNQFSRRGSPSPAQDLI